MPVFDFSAAPEDSRQPECTYTTFQSNEETATPEKPIMILDNTKRQWQHHSCGMFTNPVKRTSFEFQEEDGTFSADILKIDSRFVSMSDFRDRTERRGMLFIRFVRSVSAEEQSFLRKTAFCSL